MTLFGAWENNYALILFILESNILEIAHQHLYSLQYSYAQGMGKWGSLDFCYKNFIFPVPVVLVAAGRSVK